eukprot:TRINITY_DN3838_c0_g8_i2.p1 TRINITY_DN3838_c0_g8~~TRINITY_DN3838_c0_g8_i2.p1  ORF type:complete len:151 (-),score=23.10 TRINITY_DN3838_c0_g8_i2:93-545(-)
MNPTSLPKVSNNDLQSSNIVDADADYWMNLQFLSSADTFSRATYKAIAKAPKRRARHARRPRAPHNTTQFIYRQKKYREGEDMKCTLKSMIGCVVVEEIEKTEREFLKRREMEIGCCCFIGREQSAEHVSSGCFQQESNTHTGPTQAECG